jgi:hypothetical protein
MSKDITYNDKRYKETKRIMTKGISYIMYNDKRYKGTKRITTKGIKHTKHIMGKNLPTITTPIVLLYYVHMSICPWPCPWTWPWTNGHMDIWSYGHMVQWIYGHMDIWSYGHTVWTCRQMDM